VGLLLFLLFVVTPLVELFLLVRVIGPALGLGPTLGFLVAMGFLGAVLARSQGRRVLRDWQDALAQGRVPDRGIVSGVLALLGALLLITPGVLTDFLGLWLLIPWTRLPIELMLIAYLKRKLASGGLRIYGMGAARRDAGSAPSAPTEVGRAVYRPGEVIDTQGEEVDDK
jgi:UPF0716 protein FxsA